MKNTTRFVSEIFHQIIREIDEFHVTTMSLDFVNDRTRKQQLKKILPDQDTVTGLSAFCAQKRLQPFKHHQRWNGGDAGSLHAGCFAVVGGADAG